MIEKALGYEGRSRYVAFYWSRQGSDLVYEDGLLIMVGAHTPAWNILTNHRLMAPYAASLNFGSDYHEAIHWLVLDRHMRRFYAAPTQEARTLLLDQHSGNNNQNRFDFNEILSSIDQSIERAETQHSQRYDLEKEQRENIRRNATHDMARWLADMSNPAKSILSLAYSRKS